MVFNATLEQYFWCKQPTQLQVTNKLEDRVMVFNATLEQYFWSKQPTQLQVSNKLEDRVMVFNATLNNISGVNNQLNGTNSFDRFKDLNLNVAGISYMQ